MVIGGISNVDMQAKQIGASQAQMTDSVTKNIQTQISNAQKQLQDLSYNKEMSMEEKSKKRQEIQKEISDLNRELRQHEIEQRKEKQQEKMASMKEMFGKTEEQPEEKSKQGETGLSEKRMKSMIAADSAILQADVRMNVAMSAEHRADVLGIEIQQDKARGADVEEKKEEKKELENIVVNAKASQIGVLHDANQEMGKTAKEEYQEEHMKKQQVQQAQQIRFQEETEQKKIRISF